MTTMRTMESLALALSVTGRDTPDARDDATSEADAESVSVRANDCADRKTASEASAASDTARFTERLKMVESAADAESETNLVKLSAPRVAEPEAVAVSVTALDETRDRPATSTVGAVSAADRLNT